VSLALAATAPLAGAAAAPLQKVAELPAFKTDAQIWDNH